MNKRNLLKLAKVLESPAAEGHFYMGQYLIGRNLWGKPIGLAIKECGTKACIAGWGAILANPSASYTIVNEHTEARMWLGLDEQTALYLFLPAQAPGAEALIKATGRSPYDATPRQAAAVLRHLAKTGEVDWRAAIGVE